MNAITKMIPFTYIPLSSVILYVAVAFVVAGVVIGFFGALFQFASISKEGNEILGW